MDQDVGAPGYQCCEIIAVRKAMMLDDGQYTNIEIHIGAFHIFLPLLMPRNLRKKHLGHQYQGGKRLKETWEDEKAPFVHTVQPEAREITLMTVVL